MQPKQKLLPSRAVCERYGICDRTLDRWLEDVELGFPTPKRIRTRRYWPEHELDTFDRSRGIESAAA